MATCIGSRWSSTLIAAVISWSHVHASSREARRIIDRDAGGHDAVGALDHAVAREGSNLAGEQINPDGVRERFSRPVQDGEPVAISAAAGEPSSRFFRINVSIALD